MAEVWKVVLVSGSETNRDVELARMLALVRAEFGDTEAGRVARMLGEFGAVWTDLFGGAYLLASRAGENLIRAAEAELGR